MNRSERTLDAREVAGLLTERIKTEDQRRGDDRPAAKVRPVLEERRQPSHLKHVGVCEGRCVIVRGMSQPVRS